jgi:steroid delta-isomerase-like uncharacterized protein
MTSASSEPGLTLSATEVAEGIFAAVNGRDLDRLVTYYDSAAEDDFVPFGVLRGPAAIRGFFEELFAAVPDARLHVDRVSGSGEDAVVQWTLTGMFTGQPFQGVRATGRRVEIRGVDVMVVRDGRMRLNTIYYDGLAFVRQAGLLPTAGGAGDRALTAVFNARTAVVRGLRDRLSRR